MSRRGACQEMAGQEQLVLTLLTRHHVQICGRIWDTREVFLQYAASYDASDHVIAGNVTDIVDTRKVFLGCASEDDSSGYGVA